MRIGLKQSNLDKADEFLMEVSHPESPKYGQHWTAKEVAEMFAPSEESVKAVLDWSAEHGITGFRVKHTQSLGWVHADVSAEEAERLLDTKYYQYIHDKTGKTHIACDDYSLPEHLQSHVDFVTPTVHFDVKLDRPNKGREMSEEEIQIAKRQTTTVLGHEVTDGTAKAIGAPGAGSLPKNGGLVPFGTILSQLENCDVSIVPNCLRVLYEFPSGIISNDDSKSFFEVSCAPY